MKPSLMDFTQKELAEQNIQKAKELSESGNTQREIATELGKSVGTVNKWLKL